MRIFPCFWQQHIFYNSILKKFTGTSLEIIFMFCMNFPNRSTKLQLRLMKRTFIVMKTSAEHEKLPITNRVWFTSVEQSTVQRTTISIINNKCLVLEEGALLASPEYKDSYGKTLRGTTVAKHSNRTRLLSSFLKVILMTVSSTEMRISKPK